MADPRTQEEKDQEYRDRQLLAKLAQRTPTQQELLAMEKPHLPGFIVLGRRKEGGNSFALGLVEHSFSLGDSTERTQFNWSSDTATSNLGGRFKIDGLESSEDDKKRNYILNSLGNYYFSRTASSGPLGAGRDATNKYTKFFVTVISSPFIKGIPALFSALAIAVLSPSDVVDRCNPNTGVLGHDLAPQCMFCASTPAAAKTSERSLPYENASRSPFWYSIRKLIVGAISRIASATFLLCSGEILRHASWRSSLAVRSRASAVSYSKIAIILPLMLLTCICMTTSATSAATRISPHAFSPFSRHQPTDLNKLKSWANSPATLSATSAAETYPAISQESRDAVKALRSSANAMNRHARANKIMAWVIGVAGAIYVFCLWRHWFWRKN